MIIGLPKSLLTINESSELMGPIFDLLGLHAISVSFISDPPRLRTPSRVGSIAENTCGYMFSLQGPMFARAKHIIENRNWQGAGYKVRPDQLRYHRWLVAGNHPDLRRLTVLQNRWD